MGSASVGGMSPETSGQPQKFKKGPWSSRNRRGRDDFSCEKGRSGNGDPSRNLRFRSPIEGMGFYTPAGARWARRISTPTAHAAHLFGVRLGDRLGDHLEIPGEQDGSKNMDFQRIWGPRFGDFMVSFWCLLWSSQMGCQRLRFEK